MTTLLDRRARPVICTVGTLVALMTAGPGCFSDFKERSFLLDPGTSVKLPVAGSAGDGTAGPFTRVWLTRTQQKLAHLLPDSQPAPLLTEDLTNGDGQAQQVFDHFGLRTDQLQSLVKNFKGLRYSAQAASRDYYIQRTAPPWPGFEDIWIPIRLPIDDELSLSGRLGLARDKSGNVIDADCLVILPGLFGDHGVQRSADLAIPLRESGYHVLHLEVRGHGQTEAHYPRMYHGFGVLETDDLMQVADWLQAMPHVKRTGLIAYCWNANIALLTAWYEGRRPDDPAVTPALSRYLVAYDLQKRRFAAGVIAFSPVVRWEVLMDELDRERSRWKHPIFAAIQDTIRDRMMLKGYPDPSGDLRRLVDLEYRGYGIPLPNGSREGYPFLRLISYKDQPADHKLDRARMPVLIVHGADDPLVPAQDVADFMATIHNPRVAAVILPSGGHVGFAGYAPAWYLSLITNFFSDQTGPAATHPPRQQVLGH